MQTCGECWIFVFISVLWTIVDATVALCLNTHLTLGHLESVVHLDLKLLEIQELGSKSMSLGTSDPLTSYDSFLRHRFLTYTPRSLAQTISTFCFRAHDTRITTLSACTSHSRDQHPHRV